MNTLRFAPLVALATLLTSNALASITGYTVNLNASASTYTDSFQRWATAPEDAQGFTWGSTFGTGGGGGLEVTNTSGNNLYYRPSPASDATSTFNIAGLAAGVKFDSSLDFKWANTASTELTSITMGFTPSRAQASLTSAGALAGSLIRTGGGSVVTLRMRNGTTNAGTTLDFNQSTLTAGNWYRLTYSLTKTSTANTFDYTVTLYSIGADGTSTATVFNDGTTNITLSGSVTNSSIYGDSDAFFGYDIRDTTSSTGISHVDNFAVTSAIPEPSAFALVAGFLAIGFASTRRRRA